MKMTNIKDSIDWIEHMESDMRAYEDILRLIKKAKETAEVSYIMDNLHCKPLNELRRCMSMKDKKKKPDTDLIIDRIERSKQPNRMPNADWFRSKLGVSQGLADRFEGYCNPDEASKAIREYREKNDLSDDVPLCNEIRDILESNGSIINEILDGINEGKIYERVLHTYRLDDKLYSVRLVKIFHSLTPIETYDSECLGCGSLDDVVNKVIEFANEIPISKLIVEREVSREFNKLIMDRALKRLEEE